MKPLIMAGPCALLPDDDRMYRLASKIKEAGADVFRAGLYKGGTFPPPTPQGWGVGMSGMHTMSKIRRGIMPTATEIKDADMAFSASNACEYVWMAARLMQYYIAIRGIASWCLRSGQTMMIKRGPGNTLREICGVIEHVKEVAYPLDRLWIIERGIVGMGYTEETRWRPDLLIVPQIKEAYPMVKVMVDCSHSVGKREYVEPIAKASIAVGADGLMIEVMDIPEDSPSDSRQTIDVPTLAKLLKEIGK